MTKSTEEWPVGEWSHDVWPAPTFFNARLRSGCERIFEAPQGYRVEALLPPVHPHFPEGLVVLVPSEKTPEPQPLGADYNSGPLLERLDALAESIDRYRTRTREVLTMLGYRSSPIPPDAKTYRSS